MDDTGPTAEQLAVTDAHFRPVPLDLDSEPPHMINSSVYDTTILNALQRSLQQLPPQLPVPPPPNAVPPQRSMAVNQAKEEGNTAFRNNDLATAVRLYTLAIDVAASRPLWEASQLAQDELTICLANRSAALTSAGDYISALCDADAVVKLKRPWSKGHYRKGKALEGLERYDEAIESYQLGLQFDPTNEELKTAAKAAIAKVQ